MYTLDSNAIIYYLKGDAVVVDVLSRIFQSDIVLYISTITELELFSFPHLGIEEIQEIDALMKTLAIIPLDSRIARIAGLLRRTYSLKTADSAIAATALFTGTKLMTRNVRDFMKVPNLVVEKI